MIGNGVIYRAIWLAVIQVSFKELRVVIDTAFVIVNNNFRPLHYMKKMLDNVLQISLKERHIRLE